MDPGKVRDVLDWMPPKSVHQVQSFLGLAGYYWRFILNFSKIAKSITELLKKGNKYVWSKDCDEAFLTLKKLLTTSPVLAQLDITKPFDVYCDASGTSLGCVLMQDGRLISYSSWQLRHHEEHGDIICLGMWFTSIRTTRAWSISSPNWIWIWGKGDGSNWLRTLS
jgi:hypothetical protein